MCKTESKVCESIPKFLGTTFTAEVSEGFICWFSLNLIKIIDFSDLSFYVKRFVDDTSLLSIVSDKKLQT